MASPSVLLLGLIAILIFTGSGAQQQQFQFSSFSEIPQSLLNQLSSSEVENIKQQFQQLTQQKGGNNAPIGDETVEMNDTESPDDYETQQGEGANGETQQQNEDNGEKTFQFSSFSQIPQSLLDQLSSSQIEDLKKQGRTVNNPSGNSNTNPGNKGISPKNNQENGGNSESGNSGNDNSSPSDKPGTQQQNEDNGEKTFQFSSFSQIPQSLLDQLSSSQIEDLKKQGRTVNNPSGSSKANPGDKVSSKGKQEHGVNSESGNPGNDNSSPIDKPGDQQTFQFSSFSQIPQSLLDKLSSSQIEELKNQGTTNNSPKSNPSSSLNGNPEYSDYNPESIDYSLNDSPFGNSNSDPESIPTFQLPPQTGSGTKKETFQFSSYSQIPENILDELSSSQKEEIKNILSKGKQTQMQPKTNKPHAFNQIPQSILDEISNLNDTLAKDVINTIFNYISVGGQLTGIPPIDLVLLRFYLKEGPKNFCGSDK